MHHTDEYRLVFEAMPGSCLLLKANPPHYTIIVATDVFVKSVGMSGEALYNNGLFEVFPINPEGEDTTGEMNLRSSFEYVICNKQEHQLKAQRYDLLNPDGTFTEKYWQASNKPVLNAAGEVAYIIHYVVDITDNVKATQLHESMQLGEHAYNLFMQAPMAVCILKGKDLIIELANDKILELWRKTGNIVGKKVSQALPEMEGTAFPQLLAQVLETGKPVYANESNAFFIKDGREELVYFNFVYQPYYEDSNADTSGILVVAYEVTDQVVARQIAEVSEQRYRTLIAEAVIATAVYSGREMVIQYANEAMIKLWNKDDSVIGQTLSDAIPELEGQVFFKLLDDVFTTGKTYWGKEDKAEIEVNGHLQTFYFNFTYKALRDAEGNIYGILNMAIDVTDQVLAQMRLQANEANLQKIVEERTTELAKKNEELEYSNEELQQFAYVASHDLQEPLRKIRTFSSILSNEVEPEAPIRKYADKINTSAIRMSGLINSLLDFSRLSKGAQRFERVDINEILTQVLLDYELLISQKNAKITVDTLPPMQAIPLQINQLFYNLVGNALKFTRRNIPPEISIKVEPLSDRGVRAEIKQLDPKKEYLQFSVQDNGTGFDQTYADKIFTIFQRLNNRTAFEGYGIGLALCKKVTDTHKGLIFAEGKLNEGAKFTVILPLKH